MQNPKFIAKDEVIGIHDRLVSETGESKFILDEGLLESALNAPQAYYGGEYCYKTIHEQAAIYLSRIASNHAFEQGNKRTAFAVMVTFLNKNDYDIEIAVDEIERLVIELVMHKITEEELINIFKEHILPLI